MTSDDPTTTVKYKTTSTNNYDDEITSDDYITTLYSETTLDDILTTSNDCIDMYPVKYQTEGILYIFCFQRWEDFSDSNYYVRSHLCDMFSLMLVLYLLLFCEKKF